MQNEIPYEYYNDTLGVQLAYLISDKLRKHEKSLGLISYSALKKRLDRKSTAEKQLRKGVTNNPALIEFHSLCREWRELIVKAFGKPEEQIKKTFFEDHYRYDDKAYNFYCAHRYGSRSEKKLDTKFIEEYTHNASVINTILEVKQKRKAYAKALGVKRLDVWEALSKDVNALRTVPHTLPTHKDALRRKVAQYVKGGYTALISGKLQNQNSAKIMTKQQKKLLTELISKHTNLENQTVANFYNVVAKKIGWLEIDAGTVANHRKKHLLTIHAGRNGVKSLKNNLLMQVKRKGPSAPMLYWTLDGWDVELLYQETTTNKKGYKVTTYHNRLTMVVVLDAYNKYPIGYAVGTRETPTLIAKALQNAMDHVKSLFGAYYKPYQIQSDRYGKGTLNELYETLTKYYTPAQAGNSKAKVIEPYFNYLNKNYCKVLQNWSGYNVDSGSKNQPNDEYINQIKKSFPDKSGLLHQIQSIIAAERQLKGEEYTTDFVEKTQPEHKIELSYEAYMMAFGSTTGYTNRLKGDGLKVTLNSETRWYDSFNLEFRNYAHLDWVVHYDPNNLSKVLAVSTDGSQRFELEEKFLMPMAIADYKEGDTDYLKSVKDYNKTLLDRILDERAENAEILEEFFDENPALEDTMAKLVLTDSLGQHKNHKSRARLEASKRLSEISNKEVKNEKKQAQKSEKDFQVKQQEYYESKVNVNEYL